MAGTTVDPGLPAEVLDDVTAVVGTAVTVVGRLPGGINAGAVRVRLGRTTDAVLKAEPGAPLDAILRARRIVEHMRGRGYPTPAWLGVGSTATHVWHLTEFVDAVPVRELTPALVEQLMEVVELQAGQATEPPDHWSYAWRVVTGREPAVAGPPAVSALVERLRPVGVDLPPPAAAPDMVHADLNPSNVLVRAGAVVALVDIGNGGRGTRATDLVTLQWHTFRAPLDGVRRRLATRILDVVGPEWAAALTATHVLLQLEWPLRLGRYDVVPGVVERGHRALDELSRG
jgi:hypothetical protein